MQLSIISLVLSSLMLLSICVAFVNANKEHEKVVPKIKIQSINKPDSSITKVHLVQE